jgi:hypothetical protein
MAGDGQPTLHWTAVGANLVTAPDPPSVDPALPSPRERRIACLRLLVSLLAFAFLVVPFVNSLALGPTARFGILAWLMVGLALYWLLADLGTPSLLKLQLLLFTLAASAFSAKVTLVWIGIRRMGILRDSAIGLLVVGAVCATANLLYVLFGLLPRRPKAPPAG